jgi:hypothetical protein
VRLCLIGFEPMGSEVPLRLPFSTLAVDTGADMDIAAGTACGGIEDAATGVGGVEGKSAAAGVGCNEAERAVARVGCVIRAAGMSDCL